MKQKSRSTLNRLGAIICTSLMLLAIIGLLTQLGISSRNGLAAFDVPTEHPTELAGEYLAHKPNLLGHTENLSRLAIIIDDFGYRSEPADVFMALDVPLTLAILPKLPFSAQLALQAEGQGYEVMLHLPMEPHNSVVNHPGQSAIWTYMTEGQIRQMVDEAVKSIPGIVGVNNHMGSRATEDKEVMGVLMDELKDRNLFFIDSLTSQHSVGYRMARIHHVPAARNQVFLDNSRDLKEIKKQIRFLAKVAKRRGTAIGIGHAHETMARAIRESLPMLREQGIQLVFASQVVR